MIRRTSRTLSLSMTLLIGTVSVSAGQTGSAGATAAPAHDAALSLADSVRTALARSPQVRAANLGVDVTRQRVRQVAARRGLPSTSLTADTGLVPEARGDAVFSPDSADGFDGLGPFIRLDLVVVMPLYTFGGLSQLEQAAREGLAASEQERNQVQNQLAVQVAQAYWTIVGTRRARDVATEMQDQFNDVRDQAHERYDQEPEGFELIDDTDLLQIDTSRYDVDRLVLESNHGIAVASAAFNALLARDRTEAVNIGSETTPDLQFSTAQIPDLVKIANRHHPQLRALGAVVAALDARIRAQKRKTLPGLFLVGGISYAGAGNRDDQDNPFVLDQFNFFRGGVQFRVQWDLDFAQNRIEVTRLRLERESKEALRQALASKIALDVDRATRELLLNQALWNKALEAQTAARSWLRLSMDNWELGIGEVKRLLDAYRAYYRLRVEVIERQRAVDVSLAQMGFALGDFDLYLSWIANGEASLQ